MVLLLITGNKIIRTILNKNVIGNYWVTGPLNSEQIINIEGISEGWEVKSNPDYTLLDSNQNPKETILLEEYSLYYVKVNKTNEIYLLYTEPMYDDSIMHLKLEGQTEITIGKNSTNTII